MSRMHTLTRHPGFRHPRWPGINLLRIFLGLLCLVSALVTPVHAEHEIDHRYEIEGFILDDSDAPVSGTNVSILVRGNTIGRDKTDIDGYYNIQAHLHDAHLGEKLTIIAGNQKFQTRVTFKRGDKTTPRIHYINIVAGEMDEKKILSRRRFPSWAIVLAGCIIVIAGLVFFRPEIQKLRRRFKPVPSNPTQPKKSKPKKKRRKR